MNDQYNFNNNKYFNIISSKKKNNRPCVIQSESDIKNIINLVVNNKDKNISEIINYDEKEYIQTYLEYKNNKDNISNKMAESIEQIIELGKQSNDFYYQRDEDILLLFKFMGFNKNIFNKYINLHNPISIENFWNEISKQNYLDKSESYKWWADPDYIIHIIKHNEYIKKYKNMSIILEPYINKEIQLSTGIIHHIIFKGEIFYNYVLESPDYALFILNENQFHNIPKLLFGNSIIS